MQEVPSLHNIKTGKNKKKQPITDFDDDYSLTGNIPLSPEHIDNPKRPQTDVNCREDPILENPKKKIQERR